MSFTTDIVIGLEIHVELNTKSKLFSSCPIAKSDDAPNTKTDAVSLGLPGAKPVLNKKAVEFATMAALALNCEISPELIFSRKSYFYPDLAKNYQISQYEIPLGIKGKMILPSGKEIGITRVHMEEDPAALVHPAGMKDSEYVLIDYNRSGNPLIEIVTEPDFDSPQQARDFMKQLITTLDYLNIVDINEGVIKADANISIKESGYVKAEVKNVTGFKEIERALTYEIDRQKKDHAEGTPIVQETRSWDADKGYTFSVRKKETEADYGYIIDPDLVVTDLTEEFVTNAKEKMPELPQEKKERYMSKLSLSETDAQVISQEKRLAFWFEAIAEKIDPVLAAKWMRRELVRVANYNNKELHELELDARHLIDLLELIQNKKITENTAQKIIEQLVEKPFDVKEHVQKEGLEAVSDTGELEKFCKEAIAEAPKAIEDYKAGNEKALFFMTGLVMKKTRGKATPKEVNEILKRLIES